jgi:transposase
MDAVTLVGIDLGKHSFHLHGQDANGKAVFRKKMSRKQLIEFFVTFHACTVVMEACAGSHHMARKLAEFGHTVRLISPQFVRPFVKSNKNDFVDAEAICEAATRPAMRFVTPRRRNRNRRFRCCIVCVNRWCESAPEPSTRCMVFSLSLASACR